MGGSNNGFRGRRLAAVVGAFTLALVGAVGAAAPASADDSVGNINPTASGSIIIHKHERQPGTETQSGSPNGTSTITTPVVKDVQFTAFHLTDVNLNVQTGWDSIKAFKTAGVPAAACDSVPTSLGGHTLATGSGAITDALGKATITSLVVGAYLVCETDAPSAVVDKAQPFLVTIPYSYNEKWLYSVNVYPKNGVTSINQTVDQQTDLGLGATATFAVTTKVPKIVADENFTHYWVQDQMPSQIVPARVTKMVLGGTALAVTDYTVTISGKLVSVEFTQAGLRKLKTAGPADLVTTYEGVVASISSDGTATNTAYVSATTKVLADAPVSPDSLKSPTGYGYIGTSDSVTQTWMDLNITKVDVGDGVTGLTGAQFEVYEADQPYLTTTCLATPRDGGSPIFVLDSATGTRRSRFTTTTGGELRIDGLFVSDTKNSPGNGQTKRCYVLKEVVPPAGFILPTDGSEFTAVVVGVGVTNAVIQNTRIEGMVLPMTGSNGIVVLSIAGLALIAAGIVLALLARRRRQTA